MDLLVDVLKVLGRLNVDGGFPAGDLLLAMLPALVVWVLLGRPRATFGNAWVMGVLIAVLMWLLSWGQSTGQKATQIWGSEANAVAVSFTFMTVFALWILMTLKTVWVSVSGGY